MSSSRTSPQPSMADRIVSSGTMPTNRDIMETHGITLEARAAMNSKLSTGLSAGDICSSSLCWVLVTLKGLLPVMDSWKPKELQALHHLVSSSLIYIPILSAMQLLLLLGTIGTPYSMLRYYSTRLSECFRPSFSGLYLHEAAIRMTTGHLSQLVQPFPRVWILEQLKAR